MVNRSLIPFWLVFTPQRPGETVVLFASICCYPTIFVNIYKRSEGPRDLGIQMTKCINAHAQKTTHKGQGTIKNMFFCSFSEGFLPVKLSNMEALHRLQMGMALPTTFGAWPCGTQPMAPMRALTWGRLWMKIWQRY